MFEGIKKISEDELKSVCGGESYTYSIPDFSATVVGDDVDIQQLKNGGVSITSKSYNNSGYSYSSITSYISSTGNNSASVVQMNSQT
ncbi:hypothetical protein NIES4102_41830 (plasmid) [Chondrocystis sp. NIES-4102]|nr:hypothetical protein NIES4102_41830 [Chondrocystis sp. NIES-4102]